MGLGSLVVGKKTKMPSRINHDSLEKSGGRSFPSTTVDGRNLPVDMVNVPLFSGSYIPGGAGFLASTVASPNSSQNRW